MIDLLHNGAQQVIAAAVLETRDGCVLVDPGPESTLLTLDHELIAGGTSLDDVHAILLTHIHLDHAGATGRILRAAPHARIYVHPAGAPHLVDPSRLLSSAQRLFGQAMDQLWGACLPVPRDRIVPVGSEQTIDLGGVSIEVAYTPGHAAHHVSFFDPATGTAFVGDAAGARISDAPLILPATPPPDVDPALLLSSLERVMQWRPRRLFLTHFGPASDPEAHADQLRTRLADWSERVRGSLNAPGDDDARAARFAVEVGTEIRTLVGESLAAAYERGAAPQLSWFGLARYWRGRRDGG